MGSGRRSINRLPCRIARPVGGLVIPYHFGIDQGPVVLMIENYRTDLLLEHHATLPGSRRRTATRGIQRWLALVAQRCSQAACSA